jgi:hypothetical protein
MSFKPAKQQMVVGFEWLVREFREMVSKTEFGRDLSSHGC